MKNQRYTNSPMKNQKIENDIDAKWERTMRYLNLMFAQWDIRDKIKHEFPEKYFESEKSLCQILIERKIIKCNHKKETRRWRKKIYVLKKRTPRLESPTNP